MSLRGTSTMVSGEAWTSVAVAVSLDGGKLSTEDKPAAGKLILYRIWCVELSHCTAVKARPPLRQVSRKQPLSPRAILPHFRLCSGYSQARKGREPISDCVRFEMSNRDMVSPLSCPLVSQPVLILGKGGSLGDSGACRSSRDRATHRGPGLKPRAWWRLQTRESASKHLRPSAPLRPRLAPPFPPSPPNPTFLSLALSKTARTGNSARAHLLGLLVPREFFLRVLLHHFSRFLHLNIAKHLVKLCVGGCGGLMNFPRSR